MPNPTFLVASTVGRKLSQAAWQGQDRCTTEEKRELICKSGEKCEKSWELHAASCGSFKLWSPNRSPWMLQKPGATQGPRHPLGATACKWANDKWSMRNFAQIDLLTDMISIFAYPPVGWCQQVSLLPPLASPISFRNPHYALGDAWSRAQGHGFKQRHLFREVSWFLQDPQPDSLARRSTMSVNALWRSPQCIAWMGVPCSQIHVPLITY